MINFFKNKFGNYYFVLIVLFLIGIISTLLDFLTEDKLIDGILYTNYNNYLIFKQSFYNLINNKDLYAAYPFIHFDLFKYSSTFSILFSVFAVLPDYLGLLLWNLFNLSVYFYAVYGLPKINKNIKILILLVPIFELFTTVQNEQSNTIIIALFFLTFSFLEQRKIFLATLFIVLSIYLKLYGFVGFSLFLFYPDKLKSALYVVFWFIVLFFLPMLVISFDQLLFNYQSWLDLLIREHPQIYGLSVMGWLNSWFGASFNSMYTVVVGVGIYLISLFRFSQWKNYRYRVLLLCSMSIWVVIFNHRAESASFIIAFLAACLWFFTGKRSKYDIVIFILAIIFTTISPSDLFPRFIRNEYVIPLKLKAFPIILIWLKIVWEMLFFENNETNKNLVIPL